jgi:hypothetical protein
MRFHEVLEALRDGGVRNVLKKRIFFNKTVMPVEMDLVNMSEALKVPSSSLSKAGN